MVLHKFHKLLKLDDSEMYIEDMETVLNLILLAREEREVLGVVGGIVVREKEVEG